MLLTWKVGNILDELSSLDKEIPRKTIKDVPSFLLAAYNKGGERQPKGKSDFFKKPGIASYEIPCRSR